MVWFFVLPDLRGDLTAATESRGSAEPNSVIGSPVQAPHPAHYPFRLAAPAATMPPMGSPAIAAIAHASPISGDYNINVSSYKGVGASDQLVGTNFSDVLFLAGKFIHLETMTLSGGNANDILWGNVGNDVIQGNNGNDIIDGGPGNDAITGDAYSRPPHDVGQEDPLARFEAGPKRSGGRNPRRRNGRWPEAASAEAARTGR